MSDYFPNVLNELSFLVRYKSELKNKEPYFLACHSSPKKTHTLLFENGMKKKRFFLENTSKGNIFARKKKTVVGGVGRPMAVLLNPSCRIQCLSSSRCGVGQFSSRKIRPLAEATG